MIENIKRSKITKVVSLFLAFQMVLPNVWALTGGPSQPEFASFKPIEANDVVNLFSGDFQYNIPLMDVEGYPINLSYSSNVGMEDQASIVGLGWTLNAGGIINRVVRGIPDDFNGEDKIETTTNLEPNWTVGVSVAPDWEAFGMEGDKLKKLQDKFGSGPFKLEISYNNYSGIGLGVSSSANLLASDKSKFCNLGVNTKLSTESGVTNTLNLTLSSEFDKGKTGDFRYSLAGGISQNSRGGLRSAFIQANANVIQDKATNEKQKNNSRSLSHSSTFPIGLQTYVPQIQQSSSSFSTAVDFGVGGLVKWQHISGDIGGYFTRQAYDADQRSESAYGFIYADAAKGDKYAVHDFNRVNDGEFSEDKPALPFTQLTYDLYTAEGQGVSGMFHPYREYGAVYDPTVYSKSGDGSLGVDIGGGDLAKGGVNGSFSYHEARSGKWEKSSFPSRNDYDFRTKQEGNLYEHVYFKSAGEFNSIDRSYYDAIGGTKPIYFEINGIKAVGSAKGATKKSASSNRTKRNMLFSYLTAGEASKVGLEKVMYNYSPDYKGNLNDNNKRVPVNRMDDNSGRKAHHLSEITVTLSDGSRYVYGSQTYNYRQDEVSFNVQKRGDCQRTGLVVYNPGKDNSVNNDNGINHYYNKNTVPAHATAYQLTALLSSDYQDVTGDGPTLDDIGSYTKFNYMSLYDRNSKLYRWRTPYQKDIASYQEGYVCKGSDDKGSYVYGEKEIKLLQSIETKNFIAIFKYDDRNDAYGVKDENGGIDTQSPLKKLTSIELYRRGENGVAEDAVPIKTVHFVYDYSLCPGIPSRCETAQDDVLGTGKLTLKTLYFTYGKSYRGSHMAYKFNYDNTTNYSYNPKNVDRWGGYREYGQNEINTNNPYVEQNKENRDKYASAWLLNSIELPSGSVMNVKYESDDYAYVQNQRAGEMLRILGFGEKDDFEYSNKLYTLGRNYNYVYFAANAKDENDFVKRYLTNADGSLIKYLYYKCFVQLSSKLSPDITTMLNPDVEYIDGYLRIAGAKYKWKNNIACIQLPASSLNKLGVASINPISKDAMQFVRINMPDLYLGGNRDEKNMGEQLLRKMAGMISEVITFGQSPETRMYSQSMCSLIDPSRPSFIRLMNPDYARLGGGVRVKEVSIDDRWASMIGNTDEKGSHRYGSFYKYTKVLKEAEGGIPAGTEISSGVATYEPHIGTEENSLKEPHFYKQEQNILVNDDYFFLQTPWADAFYPSASIGYSNVSVYDLSDKEAYERGELVSHQVSEFYTAKDFPIVAHALNLKCLPKHPSFVSRLLNIAVKDELIATQGFSVELNDMHGKPKAERLYAQGQLSPITEKEYYYKTKNGQLDNEISTIDKSGKIHKNVMAGIDVDMTTDEREYYSYTRGGSVDVNFSVSTLPFPPIPLTIPLPWLNYQKEETRFNSVTNTKVISRFGVLDRVYVRDMGSSTETRNLLWDDETGEVLLTSVENEYGDNLYSFNYPSHWAYDAMGPGYKNIGFEGDLNNISNPEKYFSVGDELLLKGTEQKGWVSEVNSGYAGSITVVDENGDIKNPSSVKVIRSGRRNEQSVSVGSVTTVANPIVGDGLKFDKVLTAGAVVYDDKLNPSCSGCLVDGYNDFLLGKRGSYRPRASYAYLTGRTQSLYNRNTDITKDGIYTSYEDFWRPNNGWDWQPTPNVDDKGNWKFTTAVTIYSPYGMELENRNALGIYSAADYGYNNSLPNCVSNNAMYREIGFTGFEDYSTSKGCQLHFDLNGNSNAEDEVTHNENLRKGVSHSGRYSIQVNGGSSYESKPKNIQQ